jgi:hypothetical protein
MICTQSAKQLGLPLAALRGAVFLEMEPTGPRSHGLHKEAAWQRLQQRVQEEFGDDWIVNVRVEILAGTSHPSYGTNRLRLWGDRYSNKILQEVGSVPDQQS